MHKNLKLVFIVDSISQPRCIKRILSFFQAGYQCEVYGYDRNKYNCNSFPPEINVTILGNLRDGTDYWKKLMHYYKQICNIIQQYQTENVLYYSFGFISTLILYFKGIRYIYEISDILYGYPKFSMFLWLLKFLDKKMIKKSVLTIMTSEGFKKFYGLNVEKIILQPNKLNKVFNNFKRQAIHLTDTNGLIFAFVGAVRYKTIFRFAEVIGKFFPQHEFHFYGQAGNRSLELCQKLSSEYPNIKYFGAYKNPDDLEYIYRKIHIVVATYDVTSLNERLAEPNKLYESLFFCRPIIVSDRIFLSEQVKKFNCGYCLDAVKEESIIEFLKKINIDEINNISQREIQIDSSVLIDNPTEILEKLDTNIKNS